MSAIALNAQVVMNEICTYNGNTIEDEDGDEPDWIEIYNPGAIPVNLNQYSISGNASEPWIFPNITIPPQQFLIVFASGKNRHSPVLHTNFKLAKEGEIVRVYNPLGIPVDEIDIPALQMDHSFGYKPDGGSGNIGIFKTPTPGASNQNEDQYIGYAADPELSLPSGFYQNAQTLGATIAGNGTIRYTIDGSIPDSLSPVFLLPLSLTDTKVIRARTFANQFDILPSRVITNTCFVNYQTELPVFSIATHPDNFWDWNTGIYVSGPNASPNYPYYGSNFWQNWEIEAHIEFFETDGSRKIAQPAGVEIHGGTSNRSQPMKSLRLSAKNKYGQGKFDYRFFENKTIDSFKNLVLRNSSFDFNKTHFRDGSLHHLMIGKLNIDLEAYRPSVVFLNGIYFGVHNIREKITKYYTSENYGVDENNVDLLEEDSIVLAGDFNAFDAMHSFITGSDMTNEALFQTASQMIDTESLCDYYIAETYLSNIDWPYNNMKFWRLREQGARWRYILIDLDISLGNNGWAPADFDVLGRVMGAYGDTNRHVQIFRGLLQNAGYREYFINRYADLVNTIFSAENMKQHIYGIRSVLENEMPVHFAKWGNSMQGWDQEINGVVMPYIDDRPGYSMNQVKQVFNLEKIVSLELNVWPPEAGIIQINTISPEPLPWKGNYFDGNMVTLHVLPKEGFTFVRWVSDQLPVGDAYNPVLRINPGSDNHFTAYFSTSSDPADLMVYPNPAKGKVQIGCVYDHPGKGVISILDATGKVVYKLNEPELKAGINTRELDTSTLSAGVYMLNMISDDEIKSARLVLF